MSWFLRLMAALGLYRPASQPMPAQPATSNQRLVVANKGPMYLIGMDGRNKQSLGQTGEAASWTPDGGIVYANGTTIYKLSAGRSPVALVNLPDGGTLTKPHVVEDTLVFCRNMPEAPEIWAATANGSNLRRVCLGLAPFLSQDARWISYTSLAIPGHREIWTHSLFGDNERRITSPGDDPEHPDGNASAILPGDAELVIFWGTEERNQPQDQWGQRDLAIVSAQGGRPRVIVRSMPMQRGIPYPPLPAVMTADNPTWWKDERGVVRLMYDVGRPDPETGGTWVCDLDGLNRRQICRDYRGAGNVPVK